MPEKLQHIPEQERFDLLRQLLFEKDRELQEEIRAEVEILKKEMVDPQEIQVRVEPFIEEKVEFLKENFPELFGPMIVKTIKKQITESQDEMIDALYPIIGKLIRKFIAKEFERLSEKVDKAMENAFSWKGMKRKVKGWFGGVKEDDLVIKGLVSAIIEEIFIVDKNSGLLIGTYTRNETIDQDMIGGMLTAIKSFVEDAFGGGEQSLEMIQYDTYKIILQNFHTYYMAVVLSGTPDHQYRKDLEEALEKFAEDNAIHHRDVSMDEEEAFIQKNSDALKKYFDDFTQKGK